MISRMRQLALYEFTVYKEDRYCNYYHYFMVMGLKPRALNMLGKHSTTELHLRLGGKFFVFFFRKSFSVN